jgi:hypothetical protein
VKGTPARVISNANIVTVRTGKQQLKKRQAMQLFGSCTVMIWFLLFFCLFILFLENRATARGSLL